MVWPSGKELGWQAEGPRLDSASAFPSLQTGVVCGHCLVTLSITVNETFKILCRGHSGGDSVAMVYNLPLPPLYSPVPNKPYGFCGGKAPRKKKSCVKVEVAVLGSRSLHINIFISARGLLR